MINKKRKSEFLDTLINLLNDYQDHQNKNTLIKEINSYLNQIDISIDELLLILLNEGYITEAELFLSCVEELDIPLSEDLVHLYYAMIYIQIGALEDAQQHLLYIDQNSDYYITKLWVEVDLYDLLNIPDVTEYKLLELKQYDPDHKAVFMALGDFYFAEQKLDLALDYYKKIEDNPDQSAYHQDMLQQKIIDIYMLQKDYEQAEPLLRTLIQQLKPIEPMPYYQLSLIYYDQQQYDQAFHLMETALKYADYLIHPIATFYEHLAHIYLQQKKLKEAETAMLKAIKSDPYQTIYCEQLSYILTLQNKHQEALTILEELIEKEPDNITILRQWAELALHLEQFDLMINILACNKYAEADPYLQWLLAKAYQEQEQIKQAQAAYQRAAIELSTHLAFIQDYSLFLYEQGNTTQAKKWFQQYQQYQTEAQDPFLEWILRYQEEEFE